MPLSFTINVAFINVCKQSVGLALLRGGDVKAAQCEVLESYAQRCQGRQNVNIDTWRTDLGCGMYSLKGDYTPKLIEHVFCIISKL